MKENHVEMIFRSKTEGSAKFYELRWHQTENSRYKKAVINSIKNI